MFSKPIFKQSMQANWKLWLIITIIGSVMLAVFTMSFDPEVFSSLASAAEGSSFSSVFSSMTTILGTMEGFYSMLAILLGIVYILFTANSLVVNEVDSGSMAYTLSTPIKRSSVIMSKAIYLIVSSILMFVVIGGVGLGVSQVKYQNVTGYAITDDIKEAAKSLDKKNRYVSEHLYLIKDNPEALQEAAQARRMDTSTYTKYLDNLMKERSYKATAKVLTSERRNKKDDKITSKTVAKNPDLILDSSDALKTGANVMGMSVNEYRKFVNTQIELSKSTKHDVQQPTGNAALVLQTATAAAAKALDMKEDRLKDNMSLIKDDKALDAAAKATDLTPDQLSQMVDNSMITTAQSVDNALEFDTKAYIWLIVGLIALIVSLSSISFLASTIFNRTGIAMVFGGGIPFAFFLLSMIQQQVDNMDNLKYFTLTTLYNTKEIIAGGSFGWELSSLAAIACLFYSLSIIVFCKKDLPL